MKYNTKTKQRIGLKILLFVGILLVMSALVVGFIAKQTYDNNLKAISSVSKKVQFDVQDGATTSSIAVNLKDKQIIRSDWAFEFYIRSHKDLGPIQSGTYRLDQNQSIPEIVKTLTTGKVATDLITILPAKNLEQIKAIFIKAGYTSQQTEEALSPSQYSAHPALSSKPENATLEGYLYPETFQKTGSTKPQDIVKMSLDEMQKRLTADVKAGFEKQGLTIHQAITLASIVENESATANDRAKVASVFLNRLKNYMKLESNATDEYSADNPAYNTYKIDGLPPGPISNVSESSIKAVAFPANTDYLFFVTADDKKTTYFSKTVEEHNALVRQYCKLNCAPH